MCSQSIEYSLWLENTAGLKKASGASSSNGNWIWYEDAVNGLTIGIHIRWVNGVRIDGWILALLAGSIPLPIGLAGTLALFHDDVANQSGLKLANRRDIPNHRTGKSA